MVCKKPKILIIDDEQVVCNLLRDELNGRGYRCTTVLDGNNALVKLATEDFDVVLLDIKLPGMSGIDILRRIPSNSCHTAIIMITVVNNVDTAVEAMKLGASDYIVKPFDLDRVNTSIQTVLENKKRSPELRDKQTPKDSFKRINAIALGVEVKLDLLDGHSKLAIQRTIAIAQRLGMPDEEIRGWVAARAEEDSKRDRVIRSSLNKLKRSPLAQHVMGMTELHRYTPKSSESQN